jgi:thiol-disulfide isomerase/thioredoxin
MKTITLSICFALFANFFRAQAPNFTATDINGNTWNLHDVLNSGKTVILDFSTTWCSPCWEYHHEGVLNNLYSIFGPNGSDQLRIFYIESDPATNLSDLQGNTSSTKGDWITGTLYPIIDDASIAADYGVGGFPTMYTICPDHSMEQANRLTFDEYIHQLRTLCSSSIGSAIDVIPAPVNGDLNFKTGCSSISPKLDILNIGTTAVTSATVTLKINSVLKETKSWSGNISSEQRAFVQFGNFPVIDGDQVEITITSVNGGNDQNPLNNSWQYIIEGMPETAISSNQLLFEFMTDVAAYESSFTFTTSNGTILASSGGPFSANNTLHTYNITLPADGCYKLSVFDSYGDGLYPTGSYYKLFDGNTVLAENGEFESLEEHYFNLKANSGGGNSNGIMENTAPEQLKLFPNPFADVLHIESSENATCEIRDLKGTLIYEFNLTTGNNTFDVQHLAKGCYILTSKELNIAEKIVKL